MNDTVYGVSPGLVLHEMYTVGCADLGAPSLTIVTCVTVGANIVRPQHDRSLCRERPRTRLTITREHTVLPYGYAFADEFTNGAPRSYPRAPSLAATPQFTLAHPTVYISYGDIAMRRRLNHCIHSPSSIIYSQFKKGTEIGSLFAYCCGFFLWKLNLGSLIFLNRPEMREATLSVSE